MSYHDRRDSSNASIPKMPCFRPVILLLPIIVFSTLIESESQLSKAWVSFLDRTSAHELKYCMSWCPKSRPVRTLFPETNGTYHTFQSYENDSFVSFGHKLTRAMFENRCCHVCTRDCFHIVHNNLAAYDTSQSLSEISLLTVGTTDRLQIFNETSRRWPGPKVMILFFSDYNDNFVGVTKAPRATKQVKLVKKFAEKYFKNTLVLAYIAKRRMDSATMDPMNTYFEDHKTTSKGLRFPFIPLNSLRNVLMDVAPTRYVFPVDVDFVPSETLYQTLRQSIGKQDVNSKTAIVVTQWQQSPCASPVEDEKTPKSFEDLYQSLLRGDVTPFRSGLGDFNEVMVSSELDACSSRIRSMKMSPYIQKTNYRKWVDSSVGEEDLYEVEINGVVEEDWEPYVVVNRMRLTETGRIEILPRFFEMQTGLYFNKASFTSALQAHGFEFKVLPREFVVHVTHLESVYSVLSTSWHEKSMKYALRAFILEHEISAGKGLGKDPLLMDWFPTQDGQGQGTTYATAESFVLAPEVMTSDSIFFSSVMITLCVALNCFGGAFLMQKWVRTKFYSELI